MPSLAGSEQRRRMLRACAVERMPACAGTHRYTAFHLGTSLPAAGDLLMQRTHIRIRSCWLADFCTQNTAGWTRCSVRGSAADRRRLDMDQPVKLQRMQA